MDQRVYKKGLVIADINALDRLDEADITHHLLDQYIQTIENNVAAIDEYDSEICVDMASLRSYYIISVSI